MYKYLILFLLLTPFVYSVEYNIDEIQNVYNITRCEGPILIKVIGTETIKFDKCISNGDMFECQCNNIFNVDMLADEEANIIINIEYYTQYIKNMSELELSNYKINVRLDNIKLIDKNKNIIEKIDIDPFKAIFVGAIVALVLFAIIIKKYKNSVNMSSDDHNDSLNYITTKKEMDDILKRL